MNTASLSTLALALALSLPAAAQSSVAPEDAEGIRRAALDYAEGWYAGDPAQMERALHPDLAKRIAQPGKDGGRARLEHMGALQLVQGVRAGYGKNTPADKQLKDVTILDVTGNAATVKLVMAGWVDYLHIARLDGKWKIVNVLWEITTPR